MTNTRLLFAVRSACVLLGFLFAGCATGGLGRSASQRVVVGQPLPTFALQDLQSGQPLSLTTLNRNGLIVDIWASWCEPCRQELPLLDALAGRLSSSGVRIVAVSIDEKSEAAQSFLSQQKEWHLHLAHDPKGEVPQALQPSKMPSTYVIDPQGRVQKILEGFDPRELDRLERELLGAAQP